MAQKAFWTFDPEQNDFNWMVDTWINPFSIATLMNRNTMKHILECVCGWVKKIIVPLCKYFPLKTIDNLDWGTEFLHPP